MSVLIKGMKMPKSCYDCELDNPVCDKWIGFPEKATKRPNDCPLVEIKTPHGRLVDERDVYDHIAEQEGGNYVDMDAVDTGLQETPTVIEAEEEDG